MVTVHDTGTPVNGSVVVSKLLILVAVIIFVLVAFGAAPIAGANALELVAAGLAFFAAAHLVP